VMDGKFVANISMGIGILDGVREECDLGIDVDLMIEEGENYINVFAEDGGDMICVDVEWRRDIDRGIEQIKELGKKGGV
ncbi:beta/alpha barrel domain-containing protein, partial [Staphylococcus epidermidis]